MAYTIEELSNMKVADLRALAKDSDHEAVSGYSAMRKEELIEALATALGADSAPAESAAPAPATRSTGTPRKKTAPGKAASRTRRRLPTHRVPVTGLDKAGIKELIRGLKSRRVEAIQAGDHEQLRVIRRQIHQLKRRTRKLAS